MIGKGFHRRIGEGVYRMSANQFIDVHGVAICRILRTS